MAAGAKGRGAGVPPALLRFVLMNQAYYLAPQPLHHRSVQPHAPGASGRSDDLDRRPAAGPAPGLGLAALGWRARGPVAIIAPMSNAQAEEFQGTARFSIVRRLGAGGMGVVYEAFDRDRQVRVALKTLTRFDATALYQFKREFRALTELVHENVISLYELIADGAQWFFTMELI